jgi:hypothetical protein
MMLRSFAASFVGFAVAVLSPASPVAAQNLPPHTIIVNHWPDDVPCNVMKKYPDGTYEITVPFMLYYQLHSSAKYKNLGVTRYWDKKCAGQTK